MRVLGLDIATVTGYCISDEEHTTFAGEWDCTPKSKDEPEGLRYLRLFDALDTLLAFNEPDAVVLEEPFSMSKRGAHVLGGLIAVAEVVLEKRGVPYVFVNANTFKSWGRSMGMDGKEAMHREANDHHFVRDITDNEADAYWLTQWFRENNQS